MFPFRSHPHKNPQAVPAEGMGVDAYGSAPIAPVSPFPTRSAITHHGDDLIQARPARQARRLGTGVEMQLRNGISSISHTGRVLPTNLAAGQYPGAVRKTKVPQRVLPNDRTLIPASPSQIQGWQAAGAGSIPQTIAGNGAVLFGTVPVQGGAY